MFSIPHFPAFILATCVLLLTPGPAVLYITARSLDQGRVAGLISVLSIEVGNFVHVLAAVAGLSAILMSSAVAFAAIKYVGALYLVYLGLRRLLTAEPFHSAANVAGQGLSGTFRQGVIVAILNPKTALFFLAFLPQFVDRDHGSVTWQLFALGCLFVLMATVTDGGYALLAGTVAQTLRRNQSFSRAGRYVVACLYIGLGITAAI